jgi:hypothetical protein
MAYLEISKDPNGNIVMSFKGEAIEGINHASIIGGISADMMNVRLDGGAKLSTEVPFIPKA